MIYKEKSKLCLSFFGITISSGLIPLFRYRDNGVINNGKAPALQEAEQRESILEKLKAAKEPPFLGKSEIGERNIE